MKTLAVCLVVSFAYLAECQVMPQPEQIHISYGVTPTEMMITWLTVDNTSSSQVEYGSNELDQVVSGNSTLFVDGGLAKRSMYIHRVLLTGLTPGETYVYHCGSPEGWSALYFFTAMKTDPNFSPTFAVYGDLGNINAQSLPRLQEEVQRGVYDAVLHVGDFAYDMDDNDARVGDEFMRQIETIAAYVPYMTCPGNHEQAYNFSNYNNRFSMKNLKGDINNHFYSFNIGPAHIVSFSTEFYYFTNYGTQQIPNQYYWLEQDLKEANEPANRAQRPWIITMAHRPMYCATIDYCIFNMTIIRRGLPGSHLYGLEDLFYNNGVDIQLYGHEHVYERMWPVYNETVYNGSYASPYTNPKAPVHIVTGSAGCQERHDDFLKDIPAWSAFRNSDYGYTKMKIENHTHVHFQQISDDQGGAIVDDFWLIKDKHGYEAWL